MDTFKVGAIAILTVAAAALLRSLKPEWATFIRIAAIVILSGLILPMIYGATNYVKELATDESGLIYIDSFSIEILLKSICIAILTQVTSAICKDAGEAGIAGFVETAGKLEILLLSFPLIKEILELTAQLLKLGR